MPIVSVCARGRPEWGSLPFGNRWACDITSPLLLLLPPSLPPLLSCVRPISAQGEPVTCESPPVLVTMATSTGPGSILLWWEERGRRREERQKETRGEGGRRTNRSRRNTFSELQPVPVFCLYSEYFTFVIPVHYLHHSQVSGDLMRPIVIWICQCDTPDAFEDFWDDITCNSFVMSGMCAAGLTLDNPLSARFSQLPPPIPNEWLMANTTTEAWWETKLLNAIRGSFVMWWNSFWCIENQLLSKLLCPFFFFLFFFFNFIATPLSLSSFFSHFHTCTLGWHPASPCGLFN